MANEQPNLRLIQEPKGNSQTIISPPKSTTFPRKDHNKIPLEYTNRRRVEISSAESSKSNEERKNESDIEFENICLQIEDCSISKRHSLKGFNTKKSDLARNVASSSDNSYPEVEAFQKYLVEHGGYYGGWKVKDHLFYLKMRKKCPLNKTAEKINEHYPDLSIEMVLAHDLWYNEFLRLRLAKKRAIEQWKQTQRTCCIKTEEKPKSDITPQTNSMKRNPKIKEKIEIWKAHTLAAKMQRKQECQEEEMRKKKEDEERKKIQEQKRAIVNRYRREKLSEEMAMKTAEEAERRHTKRESMQQAALLLKYFRYEDRRFTDRMKARKQLKEHVRDEPRVKSCVEARRDPTRLLRPTLGWLYHTQKCKEVEKPVSQLHIQHLHKLGKPAWRKDLTS